MGICPKWNYAFMTIFNLEIVLIFIIPSIDMMGHFLGAWYVIVVFAVPLLTIALFVVRLNKIKDEASGIRTN